MPSPPRDDPPAALGDPERGPPPTPRRSGRSCGPSGKGLAAASLVLLALAFGGRQHHAHLQVSSPVDAPRALRGFPAQEDAPRDSPRRALWGWGKDASAPPNQRSYAQPKSVDATAKPSQEPPTPGFADGGDASQPAPSTHLPHPTDECQDDAKFVHSNLKTCATFVERVGRIPLHQARCAQGTGIVDADGEELLLKHFCRKSCGLCGDGKWAQMEQTGYAAQLDGEAEAEAKKEAEAKEFEADVQMVEVMGAGDELAVLEEDVEEGTLDSGLAGEAEEEAALQELHTEEVADECEDDATFVFEGKTCENYVGGIPRSPVRTERCGEALGQLLSIGDFCPRSCGLCEDEAGAEKPEAPAAEAPVAQAPVGKAPSVEEKPAPRPEPVAEVPVAEEPMVAKALVAETSAAAETKSVPRPEPAVETPAAEAPSYAEPAAEAPTDEPAAEAPAAERPATNTPADSAEEPAESATSSSLPCADDPAFVNPVGVRCDELAQLADFPSYLQGLCAQPAGGTGGDASLVVSDYCVKTCGTCD